MPQIIIEHDTHLDTMVCGRLISALERVCARFLSSDEWELRPDDFGFKFEPVVYPSRSTHNVIVRMTLHPFPDRVKRASELATLVRNAVLVVLNENRYNGSDTAVTVGVSLSFAHTEWCAGTIGDVP